MKFYCDKCNKVLIRDLRVQRVKDKVNSKGEYVSFCEESGKRVACKPYKK